MEATVSKAKYDELEGKYNALYHEFERFKRMLFGATSERFVPTAPVPEQISLFGLIAGAQDSEQEPAEEEQAISYTRRKPKTKPHPGRAPLPEHLPRRQVLVEPDEDTTGMVKIGQDVTTKVDYTPGKLEVIEYVRPRYARPTTEQTEEEPAPITES